MLLTGRKTLRRPPIRQGIEASYTITELATLSNIRRQSLRRILKRKGVALVQEGRTIHVPLTSFREALPEVWASILLALAINESMGLGG